MHENDSLISKNIDLSNKTTNLHSIQNYSIINTCNNDIIPKNLFFIWFNSELPKWASSAISYYKELNPTFNIIVINDLNVLKSNNADINDCISKINLQHNFYNDYFNRNFASAFLKNNFAVRFSDVFRIYLLNKYGGIYLDCDTWPIKPFDDQLLNNNVAFMHTRLNSCGDIFCLGSLKNCAETMFLWDSEGRELLSPSTTNIGIIDNDLCSYDAKFLDLRDKFFNGTIRKNEHFNNTNFYIDHFCLGSWRAN